MLAARTDFAWLLLVFIGAASALHNLEVCSRILENLPGQSPLSNCAVKGTFLGAKALRGGHVQSIQRDLVLQVNFLHINGCLFSIVVTVLNYLFEQTPLRDRIKMTAWKTISDFLGAREISLTWPLLLVHLNIVVYAMAFWVCSPAYGLF
jgi:hypothetical protein